jgi:hypothetical protein
MACTEVPFEIHALKNPRSFSAPKRPLRWHAFR